MVVSHLLSVKRSVKLKKSIQQEACVRGRKGRHVDQFLLENKNFSKYLCARRQRLIDHLFTTAEELLKKKCDPAFPALHRWKKEPSLSEVVEECSIWMEERSKKGEEESVSAAELGDRMSAHLWEWVDWLDVALGEWVVRLQGVSAELWVYRRWGEAETYAHILQNILQELFQAMQQLETGLQRYAEKRKQTKKKYFWSQESWLDSRLLARVTERKNFLSHQVGIFTEGWKLYQKVPEKELFFLQGHNTWEQIREYKHVLPLLAMQEQRGVYPKELEEAVSGALKRQAKSLKNFFYSSVGALREHFCALSWEWKKENLSRKSALQWQIEIRSVLDEMAYLGQYMGRFRTFLLTHHPNPYLRTRWGFTEWIAGPESSMAKEMVWVIEEMEKLRTTGERFFVSVGRNQAETLQGEEGAWRKIQQILHEMGSPFSHVAHAQKMAEAFVQQWAIWDEFGAFGAVRVTETGRFLSSAVREDWQYFSLAKLSSFQTLYQWHRLLWPLQEEPVFIPFWKALDRFIHITTADRKLREEDHEVALEYELSKMEKSIEALKQRVQEVLQADSGELAERNISEYYREFLLDCRVRFREKIISLPEELLVHTAPELFFVEQGFWQIENLLDV